MGERMRGGVIGGSLLAVASVVLLSGCAAVAQDPAGSSGSGENGGAVSNGPELWGAAALWVSPEGEVVMCPVPFGDSGWGGPRVCDDPLEVADVDAESLATMAPAPSAPAAAPLLGEGSDDGWTWSAHALTGYFDGDANRFTVTGVDSAEATALQQAVWAPRVNPEPQPAYATDADKLAAMYAGQDPTAYGCAEPAGGWRDAGDIEGLIGPYSAAYPEQVVGWSALGVADGVQVALIGAAAGYDLEAVRTGAQKLFPDAACVVTSRISAEQLQSALAEPLFGPDPYLARGGSDDIGGTKADPYLWISRTAPSDELDAAIARYPAGFVQLSTWFQRLP